VGISQVEVPIKYIQKQKEHHRKTSFHDEFLKILEEHSIEYAERYIWD
jgi:REP-associated tyrosine transposase